MKLQHHVIASAGLLALIPLLGIKGDLAAIASSIAIDADHVYILFKERAWSWKKIRAISANIHQQTISGRPNRAYVDILYLFHTVEFNCALLVASALLWKPLAFVAIGFLYHDVCDVIHHSMHRLPLRWLLFANWVKYELQPVKPALASLSGAR